MSNFKIKDQFCKLSINRETKTTIKSIILYLNVSNLIFYILRKLIVLIRDILQRKQNIPIKLKTC